MTANVENVGVFLTRSSPALSERLYDTSVTESSMLCIVDSDGGQSMSCHTLFQSWQPYLPDNCLKFGSSSKLSLDSEIVLPPARTLTDFILSRGSTGSQQLFSVSKTAQDLINDYLEQETNPSRPVTAYPKRKIKVNQESKSDIDVTPSSHKSSVHTLDQSVDSTPSGNISESKAVDSLTISPTDHFRAEACTSQNEASINRRHVKAKAAARSAKSITHHNQNRSYIRRCHAHNWASNSKSQPFLDQSDSTVCSSLDVTAAAKSLGEALAAKLQALLYSGTSNRKCNCECGCQPSVREESGTKCLGPLCTNKLMSDKQNEKNNCPGALCYKSLSQKNHFGQDTTTSKNISNAKDHSLCKPPCIGLLCGERSKCNEQLNIKTPTKENTSNAQDHPLCKPPCKGLTCGERSKCNEQLNKKTPKEENTSNTQDHQLCKPPCKGLTCGERAKCNEQLNKKTPTEIITSEAPSPAETQAPPLVPPLLKGTDSENRRVKTPESQARDASSVTIVLKGPGINESLDPQTKGQARMSPIWKDSCPGFEKCKPKTPPLTRCPGGCKDKDFELSEQSPIWKDSCPGFEKCKNKAPPLLRCPGGCENCRVKTPESQSRHASSVTIVLKGPCINESLDPQTKRQARMSRNISDDKQSELHILPTKEPLKPLSNSKTEINTSKDIIQKHQLIYSESKPRVEAPIWKDSCPGFEKCKPKTPPLTRCPGGCKHKDFELYVQSPIWKDSCPGFEKCKNKAPPLTRCPGGCKVKNSEPDLPKPVAQCRPYRSGDYEIPTPRQFRTPKMNEICQATLEPQATYRKVSSSGPRSSTLSSKIEVPCPGVGKCNGKTPDLPNDLPAKYSKDHEGRRRSLVFKTFEQQCPSISPSVVSLSSRRSPSQVSAPPSGKLLGLKIEVRTRNVGTGSYLPSPALSFSSTGTRGRAKSRQKQNTSKNLRNIEVGPDRPLSETKKSQYCGPERTTFSGPAKSTQGTNTRPEIINATQACGDDYMLKETRCLAGAGKPGQVEKSTLTFDEFNVNSSAHTESKTNATKSVDTNCCACVCNTCAKSLGHRHTNTEQSKCSIKKSLSVAHKPRTAIKRSTLRSCCSCTREVRAKRFTLRSCCSCTREVQAKAKISSRSIGVGDDLCLGRPTRSAATNTSQCAIVPDPIKPKCCKTIETQTSTPQCAIISDPVKPKCCKTIDIQMPEKSIIPSNEAAKQKRTTYTTRDKCKLFSAKCFRCFGRRSKTSPCKIPPEKESNCDKSLCPSNQNSATSDTCPYGLILGDQSQEIRSQQEVLNLQEPPTQPTCEKKSHSEKPCCSKLDRETQPRSQVQNIDTQISDSAQLCSKKIGHNKNKLLSNSTSMELLINPYRPFTSSQTNKCSQTSKSQTSSVESCKNPCCPFKSSQVCDNQTSIESCGNSESPFEDSQASENQTTSIDSCGNPNCPFRDSQTDRDQTTSIESCANPDCPFKDSQTDENQTTSVESCDNPCCPNRESQANRKTPSLCPYYATTVNNNQPATLFYNKQPTNSCRGPCCRVKGPQIQNSASSNRTLETSQNNVHQNVQIYNNEKTHWSKSCCCNNTFRSKQENMQANSFRNSKANTQCAYNEHPPCINSYPSADSQAYQSNNDKRDHKKCRNDKYRPQEAQTRLVETHSYTQKYPSRPQKVKDYPSNSQELGDYLPSPQELGDYPTSPQELQRYLVSQQCDTSIPQDGASRPQGTQGCLTTPKCDLKGPRGYSGCDQVGVLHLQGMQGYPTTPRCGPDCPQRCQRSVGPPYTERDANTPALLSRSFAQTEYPCEEIKPEKRAKQKKISENPTKSKEVVIVVNISQQKITPCGSHSNLAMSGMGSTNGSKKLEKSLKQPKVKPPKTTKASKVQKKSNGTTTVESSCPICQQKLRTYDSLTSLAKSATAVKSSKVKSPKPAKVKSPKSAKVSKLAKSVEFPCGVCQQRLMSSRSSSSSVISATSVKSTRPAQVSKPAKSTDYACAQVCQDDRVPSDSASSFNSSESASSLNSANSAKYVKSKKVKSPKSPKSKKQSRQLEIPCVNIYQQKITPCGSYSSLAMSGMGSTDGSKKIEKSLKQPKVKPPKTTKASKTQKKSNKTTTVESSCPICQQKLRTYDSLTSLAKSTTSVKSSKVKSPKPAKVKSPKSAKVSKLAKSVEFPCGICQQKLMPSEISSNLAISATSVKSTKPAKVHKPQQASTEFPCQQKLTPTDDSLTSLAKSTTSVKSSKVKSPKPAKVKSPKSAKVSKLAKSVEFPCGVCQQKLMSSGSSSSSVISATSVKSTRPAQVSKPAKSKEIVQETDYPCAQVCQDDWVPSDSASSLNSLEGASSLNSANSAKYVKSKKVKSQKSLKSKKQSRQVEIPCVNISQQKITPCGSYASLAMSGMGSTDGSKKIEKSLKQPKVKPPKTTKASKAQKKSHETTTVESSCPICQQKLRTYDSLTSLAKSTTSVKSSKVKSPKPAKVKSPKSAKVSKLAKSVEFPCGICQQKLMPSEISSNLAISATSVKSTKPAKVHKPQQASTEFPCQQKLTPTVSKVKTKSKAASTQPSPSVISPGESPKPIRRTAVKLKDPASYNPDQEGVISVEQYEKNKRKKKKTKQLSTDTCLPICGQDEKNTKERFQVVDCVKGSRAVKGATMTCQCPIPEPPKKHGVMAFLLKKICQCTLNPTAPAPVVTASPPTGSSESLKKLVVTCRCPPTKPVTKGSKERVVPCVFNITGSSESLKKPVVTCHCPPPKPVTKGSKERVVPCVFNATGSSESLKKPVLTCRCPPPKPVTKGSKERVVPCVFNTTGSSESLKKPVLTCRCPPPKPATKGSKERVVPCVFNTTGSSESLKKPVVTCRCPPPKPVTKGSKERVVPCVFNTTGSSESLKKSAVTCHCPPPKPVTKGSKERVVPCVFNTTGSSESLKKPVLTCHCPPPKPVTKGSKERVVPCVFNTTGSSESLKKPVVTCHCPPPKSGSSKYPKKPGVTCHCLVPDSGSEPSCKQTPELCKAPANRGFKVQVKRKVPARLAAWSPLFNKC